MKVTARTLALFLVTALKATGSANASRFCKEHDARIPVIVASATSPDADGLTEAFENFRTLLGGENNLSDVGPFQDGHRQVNWDADVAPFDMPGDFFATTVDRGLNLYSKEYEFRVSNPPSDSSDNPPSDSSDNPSSDSGIYDDLFDSINEHAAKNFQTFSPERLFTVAGGDFEFSAEFTVPGDSHREATVEGFGAVFVDVDARGLTTVTARAESGCIIAEEEVRDFKDGLSFLGIISQSEKYPIYKVEVQLGSKAIDDTSSVHGHTDIVVMDDFLYSEPQAITS